MNLSRLLCQLQEGDNSLQTGLPASTLAPIQSSLNPAIRGTPSLCGSDLTLHLQNPPMAPTSLRIKADVFPMAYKALNYLALGLISHVFQSHWLRCYSWKTPGLECFSSSYLQQGVPWPLYLPLQPLSVFPLTFPYSFRHLSTSSILSSFLTYYIYFLWSVSRM